MVNANVKANRARASRQPRSEPAFRALRLSAKLGLGLVHNQYGSSAFLKPLFSRYEVRTDAELTRPS